jgi:hypothetical protein
MTPQKVSPDLDRFHCCWEGFSAVLTIFQKLVAINTIYPFGMIADSATS